MWRNLFFFGVFYLCFAGEVYASDIQTPSMDVADWNIYTVKAAYQNKEMNRKQYKGIVEQLEKNFDDSMQKAEDEYESGAITQKEYWKKIYRARVNYWGGAGVRDYRSDDLKDTEVVHRNKSRKVITDDGKKADSNRVERVDIAPRENATSSLKAKLSELKELLDAGYITQAEYDAKKEQLLKSFH